MTDAHLLERSVPWTRVRSLLAVSVLAALVFTGVYFVAVHTAWGQRLDATALEGGVRVDRPRVEKGTEDLLTTISVGSVALIGGGIVLVALGRGRFHLAIAAGVVVVGSDVSTELLKGVILTRPALLTTIETGSASNSFPSGHTTVAMSLALAAVLVTPRRARGLVAVLGAAYAIGIGEAVLVSGWHRPSDAIGSYLLVLVWATLSAAWLSATHARLVRRRGSSTSAPPLVSPVLATFGAAALAVSVIGMATVAVALRADRLDALDLDTAYLAASAAILGVAVLVTSTFVFLLRGITFDPSDRIG
ncbi:MAG: phosphatase PAP2 family protein [Acidimicrobiia bacterium]